jgi:hypothetical protein
MNQRQLLFCISVFLLGSTLTLATGCGSVSSNSNPTPTPTPTLGATPTPVATPTPSPTPTPTPAPSNAAITGRVVDPSGAPVHGTVIVALVIPGIEVFSILKQTNADAQGNFRFDNVPAVPANFLSYTIVVAARQVNGDFYAPAILLPGTNDSGFFGVGDPIIPGANVGTIGLRFSAQGNIEGNVTSTDSTQKIPVPIHVTIGPLGIFMNDRVLPYPLIDAPGPFDTAAGPACPAGTACFAYRLNAVPTNLAERAVFLKAGYTFTPSQFGVNYQIFPSATSLLNGKPTCNPQSLVVFAAELKPDSPNQAGPDANFTSCQ